MNEDAEVDRLFDDSSCPVGDAPRFVLAMGPIAAGKTTIRKAKFAHGYVLIDAADIFLGLSRGRDHSFPGAYENPMCEIGRRLAARAIRERRNIITEVIGSKPEDATSLLQALEALGFKTALAFVGCDLEVALKRNENRSEEEISCFYAEPFHRAWILEAAREAFAAK